MFDISFWERVQPFNKKINDLKERNLITNDVYTELKDAFFEVIKIEIERLKKEGQND